MINKRTVLILGAGSSSEVGFPTGQRLNREIYVLIKEKSKGFRKNRGENIKEAVLPNASLLLRLLELSGQTKNDRSVYSITDINDFADDLRHAALPSIDDFLFKRPRYALIGKLCILFVLSKYEDAKRFEPHREINNATYNQEWIHPEWGWYEYLWHQLQRETNGKFNNLKKNELSIITFNYDRSLEFFLFTAIKSAYGMRDVEHEVADFFKKVSIQHVYGELGVLPWKLNLEEYQEQYKHQPDAVNDFTPWDLNILFRLWGNVGDYGATRQDWDLGDDVLGENARKKITEIFIKRANEIKTYDEISRDERCKKVLSEAEKIYFLGCGYHEQNINAIGLLHSGSEGRGILRADVQILGTAVNKSDIETEKIKFYVASFSRPPKWLNIRNKWDGIEVNGSSKITSFFRNIAPLE